MGALAVCGPLRLFEGHPQGGGQQAQRVGIGDTSVFVLADRLTGGQTVGGAGLLCGLVHQPGHLPLREDHLPATAKDQLGQRELVGGNGVV